MLIAGLALAFQVSVQADVDTNRVSVGATVRTPRVRQIAVTDEHRRTAFRDTAARNLLLKARATRLAQDSSLQSYDVKSYQRLSMGLAFRETARDRLAFRAENASRVRWQRGVGAHVEVLGARQVVPIVAGLKTDDARDMAEEFDGEFGDFIAVPYYPGKDDLWLFENIGSSEGDGPTMIHPIAEGSEAYFTFRTGESSSVSLPDGTRFQLREIIATPREAVWNLVVASMWFDVGSGRLVRAAMRFSAPLDIWQTVKEEEPEDYEEIPVLVRGLISPMKAEITSVIIEYGLQEQRYWLPRTQAVQGYARAGFLRLPIAMEQNYRYESVNALPPMPIVRDTARAMADSARRQALRDSLYAAGLDSAAVRDTLRKDWMHRDSVRRAELRAAREAQCATGDTYEQPGYRMVNSVPMRLTFPCNRARLESSPELPPSIYDPGEEVFGAQDREELMQLLDFGLQPRWAPQAPTLDWGLRYTRFNRIEGLGTGAMVSSTLGNGYTASLLGRGSLADLQLNGEFTLSRSNGRRIMRGTVYRRLDSSGDFGDPLSFGASFSNFFDAGDQAFYHRAWGGEFVTRRELGSGFEWRFFAEQQWTATVENEWSLFGGAHDDRYLPNYAADKGWYYGAATRWSGSRGLNPQGWRASADLRLEGATGEQTYGRYFLETSLSRGLGPLAASLTVAGGASSGDLPAQRQFFVGGLHSVRGQLAGTHVGNAFWMSRFELGTNQAAIRPVIFGDVGWAGDRTAWRQVGRPMSGVGVGASMLDGLFRLDIARGMHPDWRTRVDFSLEARF